MQDVRLGSWKNGLLNELLLSIPVEGDWEDSLARAEAKLEETKNSNLGRGAQLTIELGNRSVPNEIEPLVNRIRAVYGLVTVALVTTDMATQEAARRLSLNTYLMVPGSANQETAADMVGNNALYVPNTVRSGQRIVHEGSIVIGGDVNAGSEVLARGDIMVFGTLRGLAHAGYHGDEKARIIAGSMRPQQIRIADKIARAPEDSGHAAPRQPEVARIENGEIQVFPV